jgi:hypothetical protein
MSKTKINSISLASYGKKFDTLYDSKDYSDIQIKFEESGKTLNSHKIVLSCGSKVFEEEIEKGSDTIIIPKSDGEKMMRKVIKFIYLGKVSFEKDKDITEFFLLSLKVIKL